jgi:hydrogenase nickel incorporation protein HypA/HybF
MGTPDVHEVSLIEGMIALVEDERRKQDFSRVCLIRLKLGALGHAEPDALRFCFDAVTSGTVADGARLEIEMVPGEGWCSCCSRTVPLAERFAACPVCGNAHVRMTAGGELRVAEMEVE